MEFEIGIAEAVGQRLDAKSTAMAKRRVNDSLQFAAGQSSSRSGADPARCMGSTRDHRLYHRRAAGGSGAGISYAGELLRLGGAELIQNRGAFFVLLFLVKDVGETDGGVAVVGIGFENGAEGTLSLGPILAALIFARHV